MWEYLLSPEVLMSLLMLTFMEIVLGIDNIVFISIVSNKLKVESRRKARDIGLLLAMLFRVLLLFGITLVLKMQHPILTFDWGWTHGAFSGQSLILLGGGLFLLYKSVSEIHHKLEGDEHDEGKNRSASKLGQAITQIAVLNVVFSFDSILTAIGMVDLVPDWQGTINPGIIVMVVAVVISIAVMMLFAGPVAHFVNRHPSVQILGLSFLLLIGFMLITESAHLAHLTIRDFAVGAIPKGYLYFTIFFSILIEFFNFKLRRNREQPVVLHNPKFEKPLISE